MRRVAVLLAALLGLFVVSSPVAAASATSWRATIVGTHLHGGATTLIAGNGTGSINVTLTGVTPGQAPDVLINPLPCPEEAQQLFQFSLPKANASGVSAGRVALTTRQVAAYDAALSRKTKISLLVLTTDDKGCGDQVGAPSVGTGRKTGTIDPLGATFDLRYPVVGGISADAATAINNRLTTDLAATIKAFTTDATNEGPSPNGFGHSTAVQTFSVSLAQPTLLSLGELYTQFLAGAAHPIDALSTYTFNLQTGARLTLAQLFRPGSSYLSVLSAQSRVRLKALFHDPTLDSSINEGTTPSAENFAGWQIVPTGLRITFSEYQVAAFVFGMPSIVIPWSDLRTVLNLSSPVAALTSVGPCQASQLTATMSDWDAGLGNRFNTVQFTNHSAVACYLQGTPQTQLVDGTGRVLLNSATAGVSGRAHVGPHDPQVVLAPAGKGRIAVDASNYCGPTPKAPVHLVFTMPSSGGRLSAAIGPSGGSPDDVPPCFGSGAPGVILTNGWHHA